MLMAKFSVVNGNNEGPRAKIVNQSLAQIQTTILVNLNAKSLHFQMVSGKICEMWNGYSKTKTFLRCPQYKLIGEEQTITHHR